MNILILSCGTRNKIIQYFRKSLSADDKVVVTDCSEYAPALYESDNYYIVPRITEPNYIDTILDICKTEKIDSALSLIDPELTLLAENEKLFEDVGVTIIGSPLEQCNITFDKWLMFEWLHKNGYKCAMSYIDKASFYQDVKKGIINYPVIVKPRKGSASIAITKVDNKNQLEAIIDTNSDWLIQEILEGQEMGIDCYIDLISKEPVSIFSKKKIVMRAGETDKSISFKDEKLFRFVHDFVKKMGFLGQIDIDIFENNGEFSILEVNPRFGGGYPHAYECGVDHIKMMKNNISGKPNEVNIGDYPENIVMMKYNEVLIKQQ